MQREVGEARLNSLSIGLVSKHDIILLLLIKTSWDWCYSLENSELPVHFIIQYFPHNIISKKIFVG